LIPERIVDARYFITANCPTLSSKSPGKNARIFFAVMSDFSRNLRLNR
jgi:hypothetical protein